jgi:tetratricopeptide (TPR) repeat protein
MRRAWRLWVAASCLGCAGRAPTPAPSPASPSAAARQLQLDGMVVRTVADPLTGLLGYDPPTLLHLAAEAARNDKQDQARALYERLLAEFPGSELAPRARFELGRLLEGAGRFAEAVALYQALGDMPPQEGEAARRLWLDAQYRLAVCVGQLGNWWKSVSVFDGILALDWLETFDKLEAQVGRGISIRNAGDADGAEVALLGALHFYEDAQRLERFEDMGLAAEAAFQVGQIAAEKYAAVRLEYPIETLRERLEQKCELLLAAQHRFLRAIRLGDAHTVAAAGFHIGSLYESLYDSIVELEVPADLSSEQGDVYRDEVRSRVGVLVRKAIMVYERTLLVGRTAPTAGEWVARIERALTRLKTLYLEADKPPS